MTIAFSPCYRGNGNHKIMYSLSSTLTRFCAATLWVLVYALALTSCLEPAPTPILPARQVTMPIGTPPENTPPAPDLVPDLSCISDSDCVFAYRTDRCCDCGQILNRTQVTNDPRLGYVYGVRTCANVMCAPCQEPPLVLVCAAGSCREAQTWQEILPNCPQKTADLVAWCFLRAALAAHQSGETEQAIAICSSEDLVGTQGAEECHLELARAIMAEDPRQAADFCRANTGSLLATCLGETAQKLAVSDLEAGLALCAEISPRYSGDRTQDICFNNIAMLVASTDPARAQQICEQMSADIERCKQAAGRP